MRAGRRLVELNAIVDPVPGSRFARDQPPAVGRVAWKVASKLGVGWLAGPFSSVKGFAIGPAPNDLAVADAARPGLWQFRYIGGRHVLLAHLEPWGGLGRRRSRRRDRRLHRQNDRRSFWQGFLFVEGLALGMRLRRARRRRALRLGDQVDDRAAQGSLGGWRDDAKGHQRQKKRKVDAECKRESRQSPPEGRMFIGRGKAID